jgi:hypothetical protein
VRVKSRGCRVPGQVANAHGNIPEALDASLAACDVDKDKQLRSRPDGFHDSTDADDAQCISDGNSCQGPYDAQFCRLNMAGTVCARN